jgi:RNA polymerase sigma factor (sigma-70 family)
LIRRYRRLVYSIPVAYRLPPEDADDVFQRVAVKLFENLDRLRKLESLPSWLMTTARRECQACLRSGSRWSQLEGEHEPHEDAPDVAQALLEVACENTLSRALSRLTEPCRGLLHALFLEEPSPSYGEIATRLGRPVGSLGPTRARCLGKLKKIYLALGGEEP